MRLMLSVLAILAALPALAIEPGQAEGTLTVNSSTVNLAYCYALGNQRNPLTGRTDDIKVILSDHPLPSDVDMSAIEYSFPSGTLGVVVIFEANRQPVRVFIQHGTGTFESSDFKSGVYKLRSRISRDGEIDGRLESKPITAATMFLQFGASYRAQIR
jgi:hypothetical protein